MIKAEYKLLVPDEAQATLTLTMSLRDWDYFRQQLARSHPSWVVADQVADLIRHARNQFSATIKDDDQT